jgi:methyl-accepting chemotaxis protein
MDQVTQQNAAMVEQNTAASHALRHKADELLELIAAFRLDAAPHGPAVSRRHVASSRLSGAR